jgi:hypothetical protein
MLYIHKYSRCYLGEITLLIELVRTRNSGFLV